jgi:hypothetical protein
MEGTNAMLTLTNDHLCSHTDGDRSTYVFYTTPVIELSPTVALETNAKALEGVTNKVQLDRK